MDTEAEKIWLVKRLRKAAEHAGMLTSNPPQPSPMMALLNEAANALAVTVTPQGIGSEPRAWIWRWTDGDEMNRRWHLCEVLPILGDSGYEAIPLYSMPAISDALRKVAPTPAPVAVATMLEALRQRENDIGILLANIEWIEEATGEGPEGEDAAIVAQIKSEHRARTIRAEVIEEIASERRRQIEVEGWTPEHDDEHDQREMAIAAVCYITGNGGNWPIQWDRSWWKPKDRRRNLIRAAALIVAEIERLDRAAQANGAAP